MTEGYLILGNDNNTERISLLAKSIKSIDKTRKVAAVTYENTRSIDGVDTVVLADAFKPPKDELQYFHRVMNSPFDRTIALRANQLMLTFDVNVWETLRGLGPVIFPNTRLSYSGETINVDAYWTTEVEHNTFNVTPVLNAGYFDKTLGSDDVMGLGMDFAGRFNSMEYIGWLTEYKLAHDVYLPNFPEHLWPEWIVGLMTLITDDKIRFYDFIDCVDLQKQDKNTWNDKWSKLSWNKFLNYWVNDSGQIKIENFIQTGLLHYDECNWMSAEIIKNINNGA